MPSNYRGARRGAERETSHRRSAKPLEIGATTAFNHRSYSTTIVGEINDGCASLTAIVSGFAGVYVGAEVFPSGKTPLDALYFSFFIMGFTDYSPKPGYGQLVVIAQLVSGVLLLAALCPIHISRISTFKEP